MSDLLLELFQVSNEDMAMYHSETGLWCGIGSRCECYRQGLLDGARQESLAGEAP